MGEEEANQKSEPFTPYPEYLRDIEGRIADEYEFIGAIGDGRTARAYKILHKKNKRVYCLKTISPAQQVSSLREKTKKTLMSEVKFLLKHNSAEFSHRCIPVVYAWEETADLPYYICTFHSGFTFSEFSKSDKNLLFDQAIFVIWSLFDVLKFLHNADRTHGDLHCGNVMIGEDVYKEGILMIDYGAAQRISGSDSVPPDPWDPSSNVPPRRLPDAQSARESPIWRELLNKDFEAMGRVLSQMGCVFLSRANIIQREAYSSFCQDLILRKLNDWDKVYERFGYVIDPHKPLRNADHLFLSSDGFPQFIPIPVTRSVPVGAAILDIINTNVFQKLRGIKQLSFCDWWFPGAVHTRFEHSLGVFATIKKSLEILIHNENFRSLIDGDDVKALLLAGLVHDIGHYPFAHVIEQYTISRFYENQGLRNFASHADHSLHLLLNDIELTKIIGEKHFGLGIVNRCNNILEGKRPVISNLISGPIDCDKIDYLSRDSWHCGLPIGSGIDVDALLRSFCPSENRRSLNVKDAGIPWVDGLMILQSQMLSSVYWHEAVRGVMAMFHAAIDILITKTETSRPVDWLQAKRDPELLRNIIARVKACSTELEAINSVFLPLVADHSEATKIEGLLKLHLEPQFEKIYKCIKTYYPNDPPPVKEAIVNVYNSILLNKSKTTDDSQIPINWLPINRLRDAYLFAFKQARVKLSYCDILIDVPYGKSKNEIVNVSRQNAGDIAITELSHLKPSIYNEIAAYMSPVRIYISPEARKATAGSIESIISVAERKFCSSDPILPGL